MAIIYRPASLSDARIIRKIASSAFGHQWSAKETLHQLRRFNVRVLVDRRTIVALAIFEYKDRETAHIGSFAVDPRVHGQGYGRILMNQLLAEFAAVPNVSLYVRKRNKPAQRLYLSVGFVIEKNVGTAYRMILQRRST